jgi:hypothetical protein
MVTLRRGAGGSVVLFGWCRAVEGKAKEACGSLTMEAERERKREKRGLTWACHTEKKRRGAGMCGMEGGQPAGRAAGGGGWWQRDAVVQSRGRGGVGR